MDIIIASFLEDSIVPKFNYWIYVILMMIGLYAMITKNNLIFTIAITLNTITKNIINSTVLKSIKYLSIGIILI